MKKYWFYLFFFITIPIISQSESSKELETHIGKLQKEKDSLQLRISEINNIIESKKKELINSYLSEASEGKILAITLFTANLLETPKFNGKIIGRIPEQTTLPVLGITDDYLKVNYEGEVGYVSQYLLTSNNGKNYFTSDEYNGRQIDNSKSISTTNQHPAINKSNTNSESRCHAITKAGTQCKRNAQASSKYCWQHQNYETQVNTSSPSYSGGKTIYTGPRGGKYYINSKGKKTYVRKK